MKLKKQYEQMAKQLASEYPEAIGLFTQLNNLKDLIEDQTGWVLTFTVEKKKR